MADPDRARWQGKADTDVNPKNIDNYLVAREWYQKANKTLELPDIEQHKMDLPLFWAYPTHSLMDYAEAREEDGVFDADALKAWADGYKEWTEEYGQRPFTAAGNGARFTLEGDTAALANLAKKTGRPWNSRRNGKIVIEPKSTTTFGRPSVWPNRRRRCSRFVVTSMTGSEPSNVTGTTTKPDSSGAGFGDVGRRGKWSGVRSEQRRKAEPDVLGRGPD